MELKEALDLDNPDDIDWLYKWAEKAQERIAELEQEKTDLEEEIINLEKYFCKKYLING